MSISSSLVKELRDRTGAGIMNCKNALQECEGNVQEAIEFLRKKGQANAQKKASRSAGEGKIVIAEDNTSIAILDCNCETDSVAKLDDFNNFCRQASNAALANKPDNVAALLAMKPIDSEFESFEQWRLHLIAHIGENILIRRFILVNKTSSTACYIHNQKIGAVVCLEGGTQEVAHNVALQVAASNPLHMTPDQISSEERQKEEMIAKAQLADSKKPDDIINKIVAGKIKKWEHEISLCTQSYIKDPQTTIESYLQSHGATLASFYRMQVGEGIEKDTTDFATEVANQVKSITGN